VELDEAIRGRRAVRHYTAESLDEDIIHRLIVAATLAPSAANQQPWTFTVVRDRDLMDRVSVAAKAHMLATMPAGPQADDFRPRLQNPEFNIFYNAPALIVIAGVQPGPWIVEDCALAAENLMLVAHALGYGACWIGFAQSYLNTPEGKQALGLAATSAPVAPIIVGRPIANPPPIPRRAPTIRWVG
jgi:nitroreductase